VDFLKRRGASLLLELILGLGLTGVIAILALGSFGTVARSQALSKDFALANALARQILEEQKSLPYAQVHSLGPRQITRTTEIHSSLVSRSFTYKLDVTQPWAPDSVKNLVVWVEWPQSESQPDGPQHRIRLQTCVGPY